MTSGLVGYTCIDKSCFLRPLLQRLAVCYRWPNSYTEGDETQPWSYI